TLPLGSTPGMGSLFRIPPTLPFPSIPGNLVGWRPNFGTNLSYSSFVGLLQQQLYPYPIL
ncbi:MAG: hypothetical protein SNJ85_13255, partial [Cyanobacteriota bacterium]